jgi:hypothetical protein
MSLRWRDIAHLRPGRVVLVLVFLVAVAVALDLVFAIAVATATAIVVLYVIPNAIVDISHLPYSETLLPILLPMSPPPPLKTQERRSEEVSFLAQA